MKKVLIFMVAALMCLTACKAVDILVDEEPTSEVYTLKRQANPTTGYDWVVTVDDTSVLTQQILKKVDEDVEVVGSEQTYTFLFSGLKEGETLVKLDYVRSWEETEFDIHEVYNAKVTLKDNKYVIEMTEVEVNVPEETPQPFVEQVYYFFNVSEKENPEAVVTWEDLKSAGVDYKERYLKFTSERFGELCIAKNEDGTDDVIAFAYDDFNLVDGIVKWPYVITAENHVVVELDTQVFEFAPESEVSE